MSRPFTVSIIGIGKVGLSLACAFSQAGHTVVLGSRDTERATSILDKFNLSLPLVSPTQAANKSEVVLLTVADRDLATTARLIDTQLANKQIVAHCSGSLSSSILHENININIEAASIHPLNTFPNLTAAAQLLTQSDHATTCFAEGSEAALNKLDGLFSTIQCQVERISENAKTHYHLACVMACNYLTALVHKSIDIAADGGINAQLFSQALIPILRATVDNIEQHGTAKALSGPIARDETAIVERHMNALTGDHLGAAIYQGLGQVAVQMANDLTTAQRSGLSAALKPKR